MNFLVLGAGAVGSVFGGLLAKKGHKVCLLGRQEHIEKINRDGLIIDGIWGVNHINNIVGYVDLRELIRLHAVQDVALLTVKAYDTAPMLLELQKCCNSMPPVVSLQNGLGNLEKLITICGPQNAIGGRVIFGVEYVAPGHVRITVSADKTVIGSALGGAQKTFVSSIAKAFTDAGIPTHVTEDIEKYIWGKVLYNCALNGLAALIDTNYGTLLAFEETRRIMCNIVTEIFSIAEDKGIKLNWPSPERYMQLLFGELIPLTYAHHPSMLQDIHRGKRTEIDSLNGAVVAFGRKKSINLPYNLAVTLLIKARESLTKVKSHV